MIDPESFYDHPTSSPERPALPVSAPVPGSDEDLGQRLFGGAATPDLHEGGQTENERQGEALFGGMDEAEPEQVYQQFSVPEDLRHLGLQHDATQHREFSRLGRELGLSQEDAQRLITQHLRAAYRGRR